MNEYLDIFKNVSRILREELHAEWILNRHHEAIVQNKDAS